MRAAVHTQRQPKPRPVDRIDHLIQLIRLPAHDAQRLCRDECQGRRRVFADLVAAWVQSHDADVGKIVD